MALVILVLGILGALAFVLWLSLIAALWILGATVLVIFWISCLVAKVFGLGAGLLAAVVLTLAATAALRALSGEGDTS